MMVQIIVLDDKNFILHWKNFQLSEATEIGKFIGNSLAAKACKKIKIRKYA